MIGDVWQLRDDEQGHADGVEPQAARRYDVDHSTVPRQETNTTEQQRNRGVCHASGYREKAAPYYVGVAGRIGWLASTARDRYPVGLNIGTTILRKMFPKG